MGAHKSYKCSKGHILKDSNLYVRKNGTRECKKCSLIRGQARRETLRAQSNGG
jgi:hypothetical protein